MRARVRTLAAAFVGALIGLGLIAYFLVLHPMLLEKRQIRNHGHCQYVGALIEQYLDVHGELPAELSDLGTGKQTRFTIDAWGHPFHFESRGRAFVLVSYGRDGVPDGTDYWALQAQGDHPAGWDICGDSDRDEVIGSVGYLRVCGK